MSKSAMKYLSGVVALLLLSALAGVYLQGALRIFICAAIVLGMLYLVVKIVRGERAQCLPALSACGGSARVSEGTSRRGRHVRRG